MNGADISLIFGAIGTLLAVVSGIYFSQKDRNKAKDETEYQRLSRLFEETREEVKGLKIEVEKYRLDYQKLLEENYKLKEDNLTLSKRVASLQKQLNKYAKDLPNNTENKR